jgi:hypothetical protein
MCWTQRPYNLKLLELRGVRLSVARPRFFDVNLRAFENTPTGVIKVT